ncbi:MAG: 5'/3'-nucleotidase SurE [Desulfurococcales archaeon]|nr:5'/3'-nucleotidase SurE [Desulfurococcales archaeon]
MADVSKILVTNDDGVHSYGLKLLYDAVRPLGRVYVVAPETPKSASGLGITLHKPLRLDKIEYWDIEIYVTNGTPSDIIYLTVNEIAPRIDLVVSGINIGDNTSIQVILSSGTIGAAAQASLLNIPSIAFSADIDSADELRDPVYSAFLVKLSRVIASEVLKRGLPRGIDLLSVNYPRVITPSTRVKVARPARIKFEQKININYDPRGARYYWLYGKIVEPEPGTDVYALKVEKAITITPINLDLYTYDKASLREVEELADRIEEVLGSQLEED